MKGFSLNFQVMAVIRGSPQELRQESFFLACLASSLIEPNHLLRDGGVLAGGWALPHPSELLGGSRVSVIKIILQLRFSLVR